MTIPCVLPLRIAERLSTEHACERVTVHLRTDVDPVTCIVRLIVLQVLEEEGTNATNFGHRNTDYEAEAGSHYAKQLVNNKFAFRVNEQLSNPVDVRISMPNYSGQLCADSHLYIVFRKQHQVVGSRDSETRKNEGPLHVPLANTIVRCSCCNARWPNCRIV